MEAFAKASSKSGKFVSGASNFLAKIPSLRRTPSKAVGRPSESGAGGAGLEDLLVFSNVRLNRGGRCKHVR